MTGLKPYQEEAIENILSLFKETQKLVKATTDKATRRKIISQSGCILLEAPTGAGKTLIVGHVADELSPSSKIVWLWFAPFKGLVRQSEKVISQEFARLRIRDIKNDRYTEHARSGDVYVTTWAAVATSNADSRKARVGDESSPGLDEMIAALRDEGYEIGVIVDEAHHGFHKAQEAVRLYCDVLSPEYTLMVTATPKDPDVTAFSNTTGIIPQKISVSRADCINAGLIKKGLKAVAFIADERASGLVDYEKTALRHALNTHRKIQQNLTEIGSSVIPLMLIQVDSSPGSVERAKQTLVNLGVTAEQIAVHTAKEPDPNILALASDESVQFLIFKMAVALGFDAPRAFVLASLRKSRDADFGVQIVGRILRVDRRLQNQAIPDQLSYGYVFLADYESQSGLSVAATKINSIKTELATVSPGFALVEHQVHSIDKGQQVVLFGFPEINPEKPFEEPIKYAGSQPTYPSQIGEQGSIFQTLPDTSDDVIEQSITVAFSNPQGSIKNQPSTGCLYYLRTDLEFPQSFRRELFQLGESNIDPVVTCIKSRVPFEEAINEIFREVVPVTKKELDVFEGQSTVEKGQADISGRKMQVRAQETLFNEYINGPMLFKALQERLSEEIIDRGWKTEDELEANKVEQYLYRILATHPEIFKRTMRRCLQDFVSSDATEQIPPYIYSELPLKPSRLNLYGVIPPTLNRWEINFAEMLDNDLSGTVLWWHRNEPRKNYSVSVALPESKYDYWPDFIVGVKGRNSQDNILLIDTKNEVYNELAIIKARAFHIDYKRVMMVYWKDEKDWMTVVNNEDGTKNILDQLFRISIMPGF